MSSIQHLLGIFHYWKGEYMSEYIYVCMDVRVIVYTVYGCTLLCVCMYMSHLPCSAEEFVERYKKSQSLPMLASACPGTI